MELLFKFIVHNEPLIWY